MSSFSGGAGSVLLRKPRSHEEVYNDLNHQVVNLFRVLRDPGLAKQLCSLLELTPYAREEFDDSYEPCECPVESARRLVIKSFQGFGTSSSREYITGWRATSKQSTRPHAMDWANVPECLHAVTARLKGCIIEHKDALEVIRQQDGAATLFYVDPPYLHSTRNCRTKNQYLFEFTHYQHEALLAMLGRVKGKVILSGYDSPLYHDHLAGWRVEKKSVQAQSQKGSCQRIEFLWMNF